MKVTICAPYKLKSNSHDCFFLFLLSRLLCANDSHFMALAAPATPSVASTAIDSETDGEDGWLSCVGQLMNGLIGILDNFGNVASEFQRY